ncbi:vWA domain-containing protein [Palleronia sp. KMU-117]|uniref:vWA domain-containing protein n=1 Tax=Palleronia sp. KMU-117 TaxID=3434108 RepID=UPI003D7548FC
MANGGHFHARRAVRALASLAETDPALAALSLWCRHRDDDAVAMAESDSISIRYGPLFEQLTLAHQVGVAAHHILHVAFRHAPRAATLAARQGGSFDLDLFNIAADAIVNEALLASGYILPRPFVTLDGLLREAFGETDAGREALARLDAERLFLRLAAARGRPGKGASRRSGGAEGDRDGAQELKVWAATQGYSADLAPGGPDGERARTAEDDADWRQRVARAMHQGRAAGRGIGMIVRGIADIRPPTTPWERHLRGLLTRAVTEGPRPGHFRPSNRWLAGDSDARSRGRTSPAFEAAVQRRRAVPRIAVGIDVSGSIDEGRLTRFGAEIAGIGARTGAEVHVLAFDDEVRSSTRIAGRDWTREIARLNLTGGGGTSFAGVVAAAEALAPSILVILTDLDGAFGPAPRRLPVLWAVPEAIAAPRPPFGRVIDLSA